MAFARSPRRAYTAQPVPRGVGRPRDGHRRVDPGDVAVTVTNAAPTVATAAAASPSPTTATSTALTVLGTTTAQSRPDLHLDGNNAPVGAVAPNFTVNGNAAAKNTTAAFSHAGLYTFMVTIRDSGGLTVTSGVSVMVGQTLTSITLSPPSANLSAGGHSSSRRPAGTSSGPR